MGRQVNFYMSEGDERQFIKYVRADGNVSILMGRVPSPEITPIEELPDREALSWFQVFLWNHNHSPTPVFEYIKEQNHYIIERFESEVIEFDRSIFDDGRLVRGRIWAEMNGWRLNDPATIFRKQEAFSKWYDRLASWIKRNSKRNAIGDYLLPGAAAFAAQGGQLCQAVLANGKAI